ncbi:hypothetical protein APR50_30075 [Variovorax paradoxus]|nr:hypothetical protein APR52_34075 [Variovorax paradoxus]KPV01405.1 hypothetical protein APR50_30050 [Variovorax paradoxus]KPV01408.1 hypothetical protein APR50_30075 [Variovorax paradoxus]KPV06208.1 hypothetical protein APR49_20500 [Variovorax paradoxus]KPV17041.1 hypothetical protein APR51_28495 [Variovorax paradoxus]
MADSENVAAVSRRHHIQQLDLEHVSVGMKKRGAAVQVIYKLVKQLIYEVNMMFVELRGAVMCRSISDFSNHFRRLRKPRR